jgi:hypothetical protein
MIKDLGVKRTPKFSVGEQVIFRGDEDLYGVKHNSLVTVLVVEELVYPGSFPIMHVEYSGDDSPDVTYVVLECSCISNEPSKLEIGMSGCSCCPPGPRKPGGIHTNCSSMWYKDEGQWIQWHGSTDRLLKAKTTEELK